MFKVVLAILVDFHVSTSTYFDSFSRLKDAWKRVDVPTKIASDSNVSFLKENFSRWIFCFHVKFFCRQKRIPNQTENHGSHDQKTFIEMLSIVLMLGGFGVLVRSCSKRKSLFSEGAFLKEIARWFDKLPNWQGVGFLLLAKERSPGEDGVGYVWRAKKK